ncbi:MAG: hypothetical protein A3C90_02575 [Candidatus Magasanikbacteria bacterium RIFCSPHIGHO2_02_FULL_51_14]|uniref:Uncharacterized protein n=1 Tax=Candidatus Magasanikbacteria bacterium RIFCSPHIGHO2_02_FULL_51_14 TaxID=1798683 RepID=A0A1F6MEF2_9BACT|nr:MAG: hypothetical protein A3C90_02575 [Candidatus Magasanikbacteria bacterium RIFCSPHIGHO2_02_FULL_51_14]
MNNAMNTITLQKQKKLLQKSKALRLDLSEVLALMKKKRAWEDIRGILPKKISGLRYQRTVRDEWV